MALEDEPLESTTSCDGQDDASDTGQASKTAPDIARNRQEDGLS